MAVSRPEDLIALVETELEKLGFRISPQLFDPNAVPDTVEHGNAQVVLDRPTIRVSSTAITWDPAPVGIVIAYQVGVEEERVLVNKQILPDVSRIVEAFAGLSELTPGEWEIAMEAQQDGQVVVLVMRVPFEFCQPR